MPSPHRFNAATLPQYDGESDPKEFLLKYEVSVESNGEGGGGVSAIKAKAFVMVMIGAAQHWYANIPKGQIYSRSQLRSKLLTNFRGLRPEELTSWDFHDCKQGEKETLQEYLHRFVKLRAKALHVADLTVIDANRPLRRVLGQMQAMHHGRALLISCKNIASQIVGEGGGSKHLTKRRRPDQTSGHNQSFGMRTSQSNRTRGQ
ncbi:retrotransposon protein [Panicum miliaceum]|uniref:Retrotransposon protein n=1 Tax=Panicum miliaceum TaxID=4540 RepID=A0A3L6PMK6_PANMI|nr:retrotransposon protein [Panicum miliaceum]